MILDACFSTNRHQQTILTGVYCVNQKNVYNNLAMYLSEKYCVPQRLALLYDFLNSIDHRRYIEKGHVHKPGDEFSTREQLDHWMRTRGLIDASFSLGEEEYADALRLRDTLRAFIEIEPAARKASAVASQLEIIAKKFPLVVRPSSSDAPWLSPQASSSRLGYVLAQLYDLGRSGQLDRLKMCASEECMWIFFDRSKPGNRRWCSPFRCGNRHKTRSYRERKRGEGAS